MNACAQPQEESLRHRGPSAAKVTRKQAGLFLKGINPEASGEESRPTPVAVAAIDRRSPGDEGQATPPRGPAQEPAVGALSRPHWSHRPVELSGEGAQNQG